MTINIKQLVTICLGFVISYPLAAQDTDNPETNFTIGGYVKMDMLFSRFMNGEVADTSPLRDFYFPSLIPVGIDREYNYTDFHVKESRFNFDLRSNPDDHRVRAFMEMDFMLSGVGNEKVSNSFNPRLRHFFFEYDNFLVGQTWSTFMVVVIPDDLDFIGVPEGLVFIRQPQIRFAKGDWQFALENPTTTTTDFQSSSSKLESSGGIPDLVVRKNIKGSWGELSAAGIYRNLNLIDSVGIKKYESGYGLSLGGKLILGRDDIRFMTTAGNGLGRYVGLNFVTSSVLCEMADLHTIKTINGYVAYQHQWSPKLKSSFNIAGFYADHEMKYTGSNTNKSVWSGSANLLYNPIPNILFGIEWMHAERELINGEIGRFERFQFSGMYSFGYNSR